MKIKDVGGLYGGGHDEEGDNYNSRQMFAFHKGR